MEVKHTDSGVSFDFKSDELIKSIAALQDFEAYTTALVEQEADEGQRGIMTEVRDAAQVAIGSMTYLWCKLFGEDDTEVTEETDEG